MPRTGVASARPAVAAAVERKLRRFIVKSFRNVIRHLLDIVQRNSRGFGVFVKKKVGQGGLCSFNLRGEHSLGQIRAYVFGPKMFDDE